MSRRFFAATLTLGLVASACSLTLDTDLGRGIGETCAAASDCAGKSASCDAGVCAVPCDGGCPAPSQCNVAKNLCATAGALAVGDVCSQATECATFDCTGGLCSKACTGTPDCPGGSVCVERACVRQLNVAFVLDNVVSTAKDGFALTHEEARASLEARLPWLVTQRLEGASSDNVNALMDTGLANGADVVLMTSSRFAAQAKGKAAEVPSKKFAVYASSATGTNIAGYSARFHQAWYLAGVTGATIASRENRKHLAYLGAVASPEVVRQLNAFTIGARSVDPEVVVEVVWANGFVPPVDVMKNLVGSLVASGASVIANRLGTNSALAEIEAQTPAGGPKIWSIGINNLTACNAAPSTCLGSAYFNWAPLYESLFDDMRRGRWNPSLVTDASIKQDPAKSPFSFAVNEAADAALPNLKTRLSQTITESLVNAAGDDLTFAGPLTPISNRDPIPAGSRVPDAELSAMCWLVEGVVERDIPGDATSPLVPGKFPKGGPAWPPGPTGIPLSCGEL
jgi:basic membrane protein A